MTAPLPVGAAAPATTAAKNDAGEAGKMLEAYFLRRIMAEVRESSDGGLLAPGFGGQVFREMLDEALADRMAEAGGVGLADMVASQLGGDQAAAASAAPAGARAVRAAYGAASDWRPLGGAIELDPTAATSADPGKTWRMPVEATRISSGFGKLRVDPTTPTHTRTHKGLDMTAPMGAPVHAARAGTVVRAGATTGGFGNLVVVDHGGGIHSYYGHLSEVGARVGDVVEAGTPIGKVGSTGRSSGPHLHFEVRRDGVPVDPTTDIAGLKIVGSRTNR
jgi:murein DD-endopeptidase MepM/ murein hydrolase activator NlpD